MVAYCLPGNRPLVLQCPQKKKKKYIQIENWNHLYLSIFPIGYFVILLCHSYELVH